MPVMQPQKITMSRFYNKEINQHLLTSNPSAENLKNYVLEGPSFKLYADENLAKDAADVYRLFNPQTGDHLYTINKEEADAATRGGYRAEGVVGEAYSGKREGTEAVERFYNPYTGAHILSTDPKEQQTLGSLGYTYEGTAFYAPTQTTQAADQPSQSINSSAPSQPDNSAAASQPSVVEQYWQAANSAPETKQVNDDGQNREGYYDLDEGRFISYDQFY
jgi:hypothetical protein